jgi:hypothetical protein
LAGEHNAPVAAKTGRRGSSAYTGNMADAWTVSRRTGRCLAGLASAALTLFAGAGCDPTRCLVESRALQYEAQTTTDSRTGVGSLELVETRGEERGTFILWHVRVAPLPGTARTVVLREGPPGAPGRLLYTFPILNPVPASGVVTQVFVRTPYAGAVPFSELWDLVQSRSVSFEVVFEGEARPAGIGPLIRTDSSDWQETCS